MTNDIVFVCIALPGGILLLLGRRHVYVYHLPPYIVCNRLLLQCLFTMSVERIEIDCAMVDRPPSAEDIETQTYAKKLVSMVLVEWYVKVHVPMQLRSPDIQLTYDEMIIQQPVLVPVGSNVLMGTAVDVRDGDIDLVAIVPVHVSHDDFFHPTHGIASTLNATKGICNVVMVQNASVPIVQLVTLGIKVDLLVVTLMADMCPLTFDPHSPFAHTYVQPTSIKSLNSIRLNVNLLRHVWDVDVYRRILGIIRVWAKRRGVYGTRYGFPGGAAWAIIVACAMQHGATMSAHCVPPVLNGVILVFALLVHHDWPRALALPGTPHASIIGALPPSHSATASGMIVVTPTRPCINSTHSTSRSQRIAVIQEARRGLIKISEVDHAHTECHDMTGYSPLWEKMTLHEFTFVLIIELRSSPVMSAPPICHAASSDTTDPVSCPPSLCNEDIPPPAAEAMSQWAGLVESRLNCVAPQIEATGLCARLMPRRFTVQSQPVVFFAVGMHAPNWHSANGVDTDVAVRRAFMRVSNTLNFSIQEAAQRAIGTSRIFDATLVVDSLPVYNIYTHLHLPEHIERTINLTQ